MTFLGLSKFNSHWNSLLEALIFKTEIKLFIWEETLNAYYSIFYNLWSLFLTLFDSDFKLSLLILFKSHACFSSTELCAQSFHVVIWLPSCFQLVFEDQNAISICIISPDKQIWPLSQNIMLDSIYLVDF